MGLRRDDDSASMCFPDEDAPRLRAQHQHAILTCQSQTCYPLLEWHRRLLVSLFPVVDVYDGLVGLGGEDMRWADGQTIRCCVALLETCSLSGMRLALEDGYAYILDTVGGGFRRDRCGRHGCCEMLTEHCTVNGKREKGTRKTVSISALEFLPNMVAKFPGSNEGSPCQMTLSVQHPYAVLVLFLSRNYQTPVNGPGTSHPCAIYLI